MKGNRPDIRELTRIEAYLLSEKAGHPSHMHDYFWTQAEAIVRQRVVIVDVAVKAAKKKTGKVGKLTKAKPVATKPAAAPKKSKKASAPAKQAVSKAPPATGKAASKPKSKSK